MLHDSKMVMYLGYSILILGIFGNVRISLCDTICNCSKTMSTSDFSSHPAQMIVTSPGGGSQYYSGVNYKMTISAYSYKDTGYIVAFRTIDIRSDHEVQIWDDSGTLICSQSGNNVLIDKESTGYACLVSSDKFYIYWITDPRGSGQRERIRAKGFELTVTAYEKPDFLRDCFGARFKCQNSGDKCIHSSLTCNQRNNCGNLEDERGCNRVAVIVGSVVGCLAFIAFITGLVLFLRRRRSTPGTVLRTNLVLPNTYVPPPAPQPYPGNILNVAYPQQPYPAPNQNVTYQQSPYPGTGYDNRTYNTPYPGTTDAPPPYPAQNSAPCPVQNKH